jgi:ornithine cyclodeaminase/alanine dehydrogenase-like protein (mu-crystallin family)
MEDELSTVLRVHREDYRYIDEKSVHGELTADIPSYIDFLERSLFRIGQREVPINQPEKQIFEDTRREGDFRVMSCVVGEGAEAVKTVKIVGTNYVQRQIPDQVTVGKVFRLYPEENYITHIFEACLLSSIRTAACGVSALHILGQGGLAVASVGIIGAGRVGYYTALILSVLMEPEKILIYDIQPGRAELLAENIRSFYAEKVRGTVCITSCRKDVLTCDVLFLCTTAENPVLAPDETDSELVISLGADTSSQRELSDGWSRCKPVYVDSIDCSKVGDVRSWLEMALLEEEDLVEIFPAFHEGARNSRTLPGSERGDHCRRVFISTGTALFDNLTVQYILSRM